MRRTVFLLACSLALAVPTHAEAPDPQTEEEKTLYILGVSLSRNLVVFDLDERELALVQAGLEDGALRHDLKVPLQEYGPKIRDMVQARVEEVARRETVAGKEWLAEAVAEEGAEALPSGLVYRQLEAGDGPSPTVGDKVRFHYTGSLRDGTVFDTSMDGDEPLEIALSGTIPCFQEGLAKMKVGGRSKLGCPASIAYGNRGSPPKILPGAALSFEVQLVEIVKAPDPAAQPAPSP